MHQRREKPGALHLAIIFWICVTGMDRTAVADVKQREGAFLVWDKETGVLVKGTSACVELDKNDRLSGPVFRFNPGGETTLRNPDVVQSDGEHLKLTYAVAAPDGTTIKVVRDLSLAIRGQEADVIESFKITPTKPVTVDLEIERSFTLAAKAEEPKAEYAANLPLFSGWAKSCPIGAESVQGEYRLGNIITSNPTMRLSLPVIQVDARDLWRAAVCTDCRFDSVFTLESAHGKIQGSIRYRYAGSKVPVKVSETRSFGLWLAPPPSQSEPFGKSIDAFFRLMLPDVAPGPQWLHQIAMVDYDYLSKHGQGWERDVDALARMLKPEERSRVALCFHGWYDAIGTYCYDDANGKMKQEWVAMERTRKVRLTQDQVHQRLRVARSKGFRVLMYFADGMSQDSATAGYKPEWDWVDARDDRKNGWEGPDTWGRTYARNPAHPDVIRWYSRYLDALLKTYGPDVDGFVWAETMLFGPGDIAVQPEPSYSARAMMDLVKRLRQQVKQTDREKVLLTSDVDDEARGGETALVADGTWQDGGCQPELWSYGLFPNWQNTLWSCNWWPISHIAWTRWGVDNFGAPVSISDGWRDDRGPAEWNQAEQQGFLSLFRKRLTMKGRIRFLADDPAKLLAHAPVVFQPSDAISTPAAGEKNWALVANGGKATTSSEDGNFSAAGLIDGLRDETNWGNGHGWTSGHGQALPQWVEVEFPQPREISRFVVVTVGSTTDQLMTERYGTQDYDIEVWDQLSNAWKAVVSEHSGRLMMTRVHSLEKAVTTTKFRVVVEKVASPDDQARLLQVEAWGAR
jgi:F5/8 type C domain